MGAQIFTDKNYKQWTVKTETKPPENLEELFEQYRKEEERIAIWRGDTNYSNSIGTMVTYKGKKPIKVFP